MAADAVELQPVFLKRLAYEVWAAEASAFALEHVVARLRARRTGFLGKRQKSVESLTAMLGAFNTAVIDWFRHKSPVGLNLGGEGITNVAEVGNLFSAHQGPVELVFFAFN